MVAQEKTNSIKEHLLEVIETLPAEALAEVASFADYQRFKVDQQPKRSTPYIPVALGGLWKDSPLTDEDIAEVRKEMWGRLGEHDFE